MKPTRTINKLHFEDLDATRFEDLCLALVYRLNRWVDINHFGRKGSDGGVDIQAIEELEDGTTKKWYIQCKRYKEITKSELKNIIDEIFKKNKDLAQKLLTIVSCDVSKENIEYYQTYAQEKGFKETYIWTSSVLETKLYSENHDLLFTYFGVSLAIEKRDKVATIRRNIKLKQRMRKDFIASNYDYREVLDHPYKKFEHSELIIHSVEDDIYPEVDPKRLGISPWFKVGTYDFYHNGIEVVLSIQEGIFDENGNWDIVQFKEPGRKGNYIHHNVYLIGKIPYENIVDYDLMGDEFYNQPHIYCDFKNIGEPYEEIVYSTITDKNDPNFQYPKRLDNKMRKKLT